jgi:hypothetical protein
MTAPVNPAPSHASLVGCNRLAVSWAVTAGGTSTTFHPISMTNKYILGSIDFCRKSPEISISRNIFNNQ